MGQAPTSHGLHGRFCPVLALVPSPALSTKSAVFLLVTLGGTLWHCRMTNLPHGSHSSVIGSTIGHTGDDCLRPAGLSPKTHLMSFRVGVWGVTRAQRSGLKTRKPSWHFLLDQYMLLNPQASVVAYTRVATLRLKTRKLCVYVCPRSR